MLLAIMLLAGFSSVAASDPLITDFFSLVPYSFPPTPTAGFPFSVEGTTDSTFPGWTIGNFYETTDGDRYLDSCNTTACYARADNDPESAIAHPRDRTFRYELFSSGTSYDSRELTVHQRKLWFSVRGVFGIWSGYVFFEISPTVGFTSLQTYVYDNGSVATSCYVSSSSCYTSVTAGHVYHAIIRDRDGNVFGTSPSYLATSATTGVELTEDGLDVARVALLFGSTTEVCDDLLSYPGTHNASSSATDQWLACDAAVTARKSMYEVLRAVALSGTGVLMWLMYENLAPTLDPPFEAPYFEVPTTMPQAWPVDDLANRYMLQTRGKDISQDDAAVAGQVCLWYAARASLSKSACDRMPIFFTGADVNKATTHDAQQIFLHPEWVELNYEYGTGKAAVQNRNWYRTEEPCTEDPPETGDQCDEYPFWASEQGGPLARPLTPHLQWIDGTDNRRQGSFYSGFISKCALTSGTSSATANATGGSAFLVIPLMPALHIPTFSVCNRD